MMKMNNISGLVAIKLCKNHNILSPFCYCQIFQKKIKIMYLKTQLLLSLKSHVIQLSCPDNIYSSLCLWFGFALSKLNWFFKQFRYSPFLFLFFYSEKRNIKELQGEKFILIAMQMNHQNLKTGSY